MKKNKKTKKKTIKEEESEHRERPPVEEGELENQTLNQKKIAFAQSAHLEAVLALLKESAGEQKLLGENEFETIKNAVTLDANANMIKNFINLIDHIKKGGLHQPL